MKTYTEAELQYKISEIITDNQPSLSSRNVEEIYNTLKTIGEQSARYVENELLQVIESLQAENRQLKDRLAKLVNVE